MNYFYFIIYFLFLFGCTDVKVNPVKEKTIKYISNDIFIPKDAEYKGILFLDQVKKKNTYYSSYDLRITNYIYSSSRDWRFFNENFKNIGDVKLVIKISNNVYKYLSNQIYIDFNDNNIKPIRDCVNNCFKKFEQTNEEVPIKCDCKE